MKYFFLKSTGFLLFLILFSACSATNNLTLSVTEPAPVYINKNSTKIGIINRSIPDKKYQVIDAIDKVLSLEGKELDKKGSLAAIDALKSQLQKNNYIDKTIVIDSVDFKKYGMDQFANEIPWDILKKIAVKNDIQVIFELSFYDTDANVSYKTNTVTTTNILGIKVPMIEHEATINTLVKTGWRIYDVVDEKVSDQYFDTKTVTVVGKGLNPLQAYETVVGRKAAVLNISNKIGQNYAYRILPYMIRVSRDYFVKGTNNFEIGKRNAIAGNWDEAAKFWLQETTNSDPKIAGRAFYNMAISNEINGDLEKALDWATKSYTNYNNKEAKTYITILKQRIAKRDQLNSESR